MMDIEKLIGDIQPPQQTTLTKWDKLYRAGFYGVIASSSCTAVFIARMLPPALPVVGLLFGAGVLGLIAWALLTPGNQNLQIAFTCLAFVTGICLALRDAMLLLALLDTRYLVGSAAIGVVLLVAGIMEAKSDAK